MEDAPEYITPFLSSDPIHQSEVAEKSFKKNKKGGEENLRNQKNIDHCFRVRKVGLLK